MHIRAFVAAVLLIFTSFSARQEKPVPVVIFPGVGWVSLHLVRATGEVPYADFLASDGKKLLRVQPETDKFWTVDDPSSVTGPQILYGPFITAGLPNPLVLVVDRYIDASGDCGTIPSLIGEWNGKLRVLTPQLPEFFTRGGGVYLQPASNHRPARLNVFTGMYQDGDVHSDGPSKWVVYSYDFDTNAGKFVLVKQTELPTSEVKFEGYNLLLAIPELMYC